MPDYPNNPDAVASQLDDSGETWGIHAIGRGFSQSKDTGWVVFQGDVVFKRYWYPKHALFEVSSDHEMSRQEAAQVTSEGQLVLFDQECPIVPEPEHRQYIYRYVFRAESGDYIWADPAGQEMPFE